MLDIQEATRQFEEAKARRSNWESMWEDCIDYCMPARQGFWDSAPGQERTERVFDETPVMATAEFASRMQSAIMPPGQRWFTLQVAEQADPAMKRQVQADLDLVTEFLWNQIARSNLDAEIHEAFMDLAIGTCGMTIVLNAQDDLVFKTAPLPTLWLREGPDGRVGGLFRRKPNVDIEYIRAKYGVQLPGSKGTTCAITEACVKDYTDLANESWDYLVWADIDATILQRERYEGTGTSPWVAARWAETADEWYGRGPLINILPAIRSVNFIKELIFENAEMAIGGIWQYPNDGTINPHQIQIAPNTFIPKSPGSEGIQPLTSPARFDVAEANLQDLRSSIKRALFSEEFTPMGRTPLSAQEIAARQTDLAARIGSPFSRVMKELVEPIVVRVARLYVDAGKIKLPKIDGKEIKVMPVSPMARAMKADQIQRIQSFVQSMVATMGPEAAGTYLNTEEVVMGLASLYEVPANMLHNNESRKEEAKRAAEMGQMLEGAVKTQPSEPLRQLIEKGQGIGQPTNYGA